MTMSADRVQAEKDAFDSIVGSPHAWLFAAYSARRVAGLAYKDMTEREREPFDYGLFCKSDGPEEERFTPDDLIRLTANHSIVHTYVFLAATALENLLKGALADALFYADTDRLATGGKLRQACLTHDLITLAEGVGLTLSTDERNHLVLCSDAIGARGRFPSGVAFDKGGVAPPMGVDVAVFHEWFEAVFSRVEPHVREGAALAPTVT